MMRCLIVVTAIIYGNFMLSQNKMDMAMHALPGPFDQGTD